MAYYDALVAKWATAPAGTTDQKLVWLNSETVTGPAVPMRVPPYEIFNRTDRAEYNVLPKPEDKASVQRMLAQVVVDYSPNSEMRRQYLALFPAGSKTQQNLAPYVATFDAPKVPWAKANGYPVPVTPQMLVEAGIIPPGSVTPLP